MTELTSMMNIGKEMAGKLHSVGIGSAEELVHLYALEGAVRNTEFNSIPEDRKKELKAFRDFLKR
ncbi:hypothetical protein D5274_01445 [bacterium 1XD42-94]|nr:hypothetical protein [bacterium 1XD42-76]NBK03870.1 hypothetical protein [bacterium 1XD42-94]